MPFTLAHPAAVLPFRRWCPRVLNLPALITGALSLDAGYAFSRWRLDILAHEPRGLILFGLPMGLVLFLAWRFVLPPLVRLLPERIRESLLPMVEFPLSPWWGILSSILLGACTHLVWDAFTHKDGWLVQQVDFLQEPMFLVGNRRFRACHLLWYISSFAGSYWLYIAFRNWRKAVTEPPTWRAHLAAAGVSLAVLALAALHHAVRGLPGMALVGGMSLALVAAIQIFTPPRRLAAGSRQPMQTPAS